MAIILRFVDKQGFIRERFFDIVHVNDTKSVTLKQEICKVLDRHNLSIQNMRGQGYDGASNMRGEWNGLQALFLEECAYAYYIHCFAHRLQLVLVATSQSIIPIENFFSYLNMIINLVSSSKRQDQLHMAMALQIHESTTNGELETGKGKNQIGNIQRPGDTRWSSHLMSLRSLLEMFDPVLHVLEDMGDEKCRIPSRSSARGACEVMLSFEFVFILHFMIELLGKTSELCKLLQQKSQDILNATHLVANTKEILENFRERGWEELLQKVEKFCEKHDIGIPDMNGYRLSSKGRPRKSDSVTSEHFYRIEIFIGTIDCILQEMNIRFNEDMMELLKLSTALDPKNINESFRIHDICQLVEKFYPSDFTNQERLQLRCQLELFEVEVRKNMNLQEIKTIAELCQVLSETGKSISYSLIDRLIRLILTLPVSTATSERAFSAMKIVKNRLRNKMEDDFLSSALIMYIEKDITRSFDVDSVIDEFEAMKKRRTQLRLR